MIPAKSAIAPPTIGPTTMPMLNAVLNRAILDPIPYFLPCSTARAEAAGMAIALPILPKTAIASNRLKVFPKGTTIRKIELTRQPPTTKILRLKRSAILPEGIPSNDISNILTARRIPTSDGRKPKLLAARIGKKTKKILLPVVTVRKTYYLLLNHVNKPTPTKVIITPK